MKRVSLLLILVSAIIFPTFAQETTETTLAEAVTRSTKGDNWFVAAGGMANLMWGNQDKHADPLKRITFGGELAVGKWFNRDFGLRLQGNYGALRGWQREGVDLNGYYMFPDNKLPQYSPDLKMIGAHVPYGLDKRFGGPLDLQSNKLTEQQVYAVYSGGDSPLKHAKGRNGEGGFWQDFNYSTVTLDLMANASNLFYGHYTDRRFNIIPFVGVGLINAYDNKTTTPDFWYVAFKAGVHIDCKITSGLSIYIEPKAYATNDEFDGYRGTAFADALTNLSLGLKYTFNKGFADIGRLTLLEIDRLNDRINENRQRLDEHQDILDRHEQQIRDLYDRIEKCCEEKPVIVVDKPADTDALPLDIFFKIDSYKIQPQEQYKIDKIVEFLNTKKGAKVLLVGYADVKTAYPKYNMTLSKKRVDAVAAQLKAKGVPANRISLDWKGDTVQPFEINEMNRCVIAIEQR